MSILAVDFGSVHTRAVLIDQVGGTFELVGFARTRTTDGYPAQNVKIGLDRVLAQLTDATGRKFYNAEGRVISPELPDRSGVDTFVVTASGGRPLRAVVVGLMPDLSVRAALDALSNTYVDVVETVSLQDGRTSDQRLNAVLQSFPNVILITGGTDGGATQSLLELVRSVRMAVSVMDKRRRPTVIYAGNGLMADRMTAMFAGVADVLIAPNIRPHPGILQIEPTRALLAEAFNRYSETRGMGFSELAMLTPDGVRPSARGYSVVATYLAKLRGEKVIAFDVGSAATVMAVATPRSHTFSIRTDLGVGHNAANLLDIVGVDTIGRWLAFEVTPEDFYSFVTNKSLRPGTVPFSLREAYFEHAMLKAAVAEIAHSTGVSSLPIADTVIVGGAAVNDTGNPGYSALLAIDALGLKGVAKIWSDPFGLTAALGAVADSRSEAVTQVLDGTGYTVLATAVCVSGTPRIGKPALQITVEPEFGDKYSLTVEGGHLATIPLQFGDKATIRIKTVGRGLDINGKRAVRLKVTGGGAGVIIDARGRPLPLDLAIDQKRMLFPQWVAEVTGDEPREVVVSSQIPKLDIKPPSPPAGPEGDELSPARQRQAKREQRRARPKVEDAPSAQEPTIEDLRNALS